MKTGFYLIKNKVPELSYAFTLNGVELPVLDITHPLFIASINEEKLKKCSLMLRKMRKGILSSGFPVQVRSVG